MVTCHSNRGKPSYKALPDSWNAIEICNLDWEKNGIFHLPFNLFSHWYRGPLPIFPLAAGCRHLRGKISVWKAHLPWKMRMSHHRTKCCRIIFFITSGKTVWKLDRLCKNGELSPQHWGAAERVCRYCCNLPHVGTNSEELILTVIKICKHITQLILGPVLRDFYSLIFFCLVQDNCFFLYLLYPKYWIFIHV